jgi:nucleotide-binding universal stress UspA family protein
MAFFRRILIATDFSAGADRALEHAAELAASFAAPLIVLHVYQTTVVFDEDGPWSSREADTTTLRAGIEDELVRCADRARALRAPIVDIAIAKGEPAVEILRAAVARGCDLIVLGAHGQRGAQDGLGSVTERVVGAATCAVLVAARDPVVS